MIRTPIIIKSGSIEILADHALIELNAPADDTGRYYSYALVTGAEATVDVFTASRGGPLVAAIDGEAGARTISIWNTLAFEGRPGLIVSVAASGFLEKLVIQVLGQRLEKVEEPRGRKQVYRLDKGWRVGSLVVADAGGRELVRREAVDHAVLLVQTAHTMSALPDAWVKGAVLAAGAVILAMGLGSLFGKRDRE